jgi:hypothetical protein
MGVEEEVDMQKGGNPIDKGNFDGSGIPLVVLKIQL